MVHYVSDLKISAPTARRDGPRTFTDQAFTGRVVLDDASFCGCTFQRTVLVYSGGAPPRLQDCTFKGVTFEFAGAAARTLAFLKAMSAPSSGFRELFKASFPKLFGH